MKNDITIHGYLGRDPEMEQKDGKNGKYYQTGFSLGVGRDFGDETDWFNCVINGSKAEIAEKYGFESTEFAEGMADLQERYINTRYKSIYHIYILSARSKHFFKYCKCF